MSVDACVAEIEVAIARHLASVCANRNGSHTTSIVLEWPISGAFVKPPLRALVRTSDEVRRTIHAWTLCARIGEQESCAPLQPVSKVSAWFRSVWEEHGDRPAAVSWALPALKLPVRGHHRVTMWLKRPTNAVDESCSATACDGVEYEIAVTTTDIQLGDEAVDYPRGESVAVFYVESDETGIYVRTSFETSPPAGSAPDGQLRFVLHEGDVIEPRVKAFCASLPFSALSSEQVCDNLREVVRTRNRGYLVATKTTRTDLLRWFVATWATSPSSRPRDYLEIGCENGRNFEAVRRALPAGSTATCVDPDVTSRATFFQTSDAFFASLPSRRRFELVFVDGLHTAEQAYRDAMHALAHLADDGAVILHDVNGGTKAVSSAQRDAPGIWNGDVWRAIVALRTHADLDIVTADFDFGCAIVVRRPNTDPLSELPLHHAPVEMSYEALHANREQLLRLMTFRQARRWLEAHIGF